MRIGPPSAGYSWPTRGLYAGGKRFSLAEKVHPHTMEHTLATTLLNQGVPLVAVQSILGHEKPETNQLYAVWSGETRHQAYQRYFV
ncbi:MAG: integrase [Sulfobacillus benefaciens]|uniref:Integrase n=1 Tax=Sulfobacillus benefaciens TaxID=453960 RepID=A0A2T2XIV5_9FIRM|nr:MAG: integrase [Sulfobacillus benefaciens]